MSVFDCRQIGTYPTTLPIMSEFLQKIRKIESENGIVSISIGHSFPYADVPELGARILVITDNDKKRGDALAAQIGAEFISMRSSVQLTDYELNEGISVALAESEGPIVIVDSADNAGGGAPSDNTTILRALIERKVENVVVGPIWDPVAVRLCFAAGIGRKMPLRIGGKVGPSSGEPVDVDCEIIGLTPESWQRFGPTKVPLGASAAVRIGDIVVVVVETRNQAFGLELFTNLGIDPRKKKIIVVKSHYHFMAAYAPIAKKVIRVISDGALNPDFRKIPYTRVTRPIWPLDEETSPRLVY
jgi:microcystin degradation protein MlrC